MENFPQKSWSLLDSSRRSHEVWINFFSIFYSCLHDRHLYMPDPYFLRQISYTTQNSMFKDETFSLVNSGTPDDADLVFTFKTRLMLELSCDMEYSHFPFDTQSCPVLLASMRELGTDKMSVKWKTLQVRWIEKQISNLVLKLAFVEIFLHF